MNLATLAKAQPDYSAIKSKQNAAWSSGSYSKIGVTLQITGEELAESANLQPGSSVLDVAGGNGNATLAFARRWCDVTSTDYVGALLDEGQVRSRAEGLDVNFKVADAEELPFTDENFDAVVSTFGVMFTPNQQQSASELLRVCKSGGTIALANWTPDGFIGQLFKTLGKHVAPPAGVNSPALWGDEKWIEDTFGPAASSIKVTPKKFNFRYPSPEQFVDYWRTFYGPVHKAFLAVGDEGASALEQGILDTVAKFNIGKNGTMVVPSKYVELLITKA